MSSPSFQVRPEIAVSVRHPPSYMAKSQVHSSDEDISPTPHSQVRAFGLTRGSLPSRSHLAMSGDIFGCHSGEAGELALASPG